LVSDKPRRRIQTYTVLWLACLSIHACFFQVMFPDILTEINTDSRTVTQQCCKNLYTPQNINRMHNPFYKSQGVVRDKFFTLLIAKGSFFLETINKKSHLEFFAPTGDAWCMSLVTPYQVIKFWYVVGSLEYEKWKQYQNVHGSTVQAYTLAKCTTHMPHRSYYAAIALTSARRLHQHWTNLVILAKHRLWLPDDGFFVNRNMIEQPL